MRRKDVQGVLERLSVIVNAYDVWKNVYYEANNHFRCMFRVCMSANTVHFTCIHTHTHTHIPQLARVFVLLKPTAFNLAGKSANSPFRDV
jgi:hypothetical protein